MLIRNQLMYQQLQHPLSAPESADNGLRTNIITGSESVNANLQEPEGELVATLETNASAREKSTKGILYRKENFANPLASHQIPGTKINITPHIRDMKRSEVELQGLASESISDEAMDAFLRKAFRLFDIQ